MHPVHQSREDPQGSLTGVTWYRALLPAARSHPRLCRPAGPLSHMAGKLADRPAGA